LLTSAFPPGTVYMHVCIWKSNNVLCLRISMLAWKQSVCGLTRARFCMQTPVCTYV
jgi:hypothetical protein